MSKKYRIAIVAHCLGLGGLQRVGAILSMGLTAAGHKVHVISMEDVIDFSFDGELLNLGSYKSKYFLWLNKLYRFIIFFHYLYKKKIEIVIDLRGRQVAVLELLISLIAYRGRKVYLSVQSSRIATYFSKSDWISKFIHNRATSTVCVSEGVRERVLKKYDQIPTSVIYNPYDKEEIDRECVKALDEDYGDYFIAVGRMTCDVKGFDMLIKAFAKTSAKEDIRLMILAEGNLQPEYEDLAQSLEIRDRVIFHPFDVNPFKYMKNARSLILSSRLEGFPLVIGEALACGTPVIAFDCPTGPAETVKNGYNGLLIPHMDIEALAKGIDRLYYDKELYKTCKRNAKDSVQHLSIEALTREWEKLFARE